MTTSKHNSLSLFKQVAAGSYVLSATGLGTVGTWKVGYVTYWQVLVETVQYTFQLSTSTHHSRVGNAVQGDMTSGDAKKWHRARCNPPKHTVRSPTTPLLLEANTAIYTDNSD